MQTPARPRPGWSRGAEPEVLVRFRPTWRQALGHGAYAGAVASGGLALTAAAAAAAPALVDAVADTDLRRPLPALGWLVFVLLPVPLGAVAGLALARRVGVELDELGVHATPDGIADFAPWKLVTEVRTERRRRRTVVALCLDDGSVVRLPAPYDGALLGHDPVFERKLFRIHHAWETHRYG
jgi:hypothetical protein